MSEERPKTLAAAIAVIAKKDAQIARLDGTGKLMEMSPIDAGWSSSRSRAP